MDVEVARWLVSAEAEPALRMAGAEADPSSLAAAARLRRQWPAAQAAAVLGQVALRRRAATKFGDDAERLFFTADGLEQATRAEVARWRAARYVAAGAQAVVDLGCGLGADALAFADAGLQVTAVEVDPATAVLAQANLGDRGRVLCGDAIELAGGLLAGGAAVFLDPARRTAAGRSWRTADFSPPWDVALDLLAGRAPSGPAAVGCIKAAPGLPSSLIPDQLAATWISHRGDLVECSLWSGPWQPGRTAVLLPDGQQLLAGERREPPSGPVSRYLYEPDPAVIRAGAVMALAEQLGAHAAEPGIAYLFADSHHDSIFARCFEVQQELPYDDRVLRGWVRDQGIGVLEIKVRGIDVDPAVLRRQLKPKGKASATLVLTPTVAGARALVVQRVSS